MHSVQTLPRPVQKSIYIPKEKPFPTFSISLPNFTTEGIKYMGSKKEILKYIWEKTKGLCITSVFDGFAGTTRVGQFFNNNNTTVISNDLNIRSQTFGKTFLLNDIYQQKQYQEKIDYLNSLDGYRGYYSQTYGGVDFDGSSVQADGKKKLRQIHNTQKLDSIRNEIDSIAQNDIEKHTLLTSLIFALDKVDSSLGHFSSYLKERSPRSYKNMHLELPRFYETQRGNQVLAGDVFEVLPNIQTDLAYYDPPYGSNNDKMPSSRVRYGQYYHIWETIIRHDLPNTIGAINKRSDATVEKTYSIFEDYTKQEDVYICERAIFDLIQQSRSKYILFSYNTNGRARIPYILEFLENHKYRYELTNIGYKKNVMAGMKRTFDRDNLGNKENHEILLLIYNS